MLACTPRLYHPSLLLLFPSFSITVQLLRAVPHRTPEWLVLTVCIQRILSSSISLVFSVLETTACNYGMYVKKSIFAFDTLWIAAGLRCRGGQPSGRLRFPVRVCTAATRGGEKRQSSVAANQIDRRV